MIPYGFITQWKKYAPWINDYQVEQDLIIERAIVEIFSNSELFENLAFRGGTSLHKLFLNPQARYSEDIDLVQIEPGNIGDILTLLRERLSFLGTANYNLSNHNATLIYRFESEAEPVTRLKLKVEINTREHFTVYGFNEHYYRIQSDWFEGNCRIKSYKLEELLSTKLRALYQRNKGRDLFDIFFAFENLEIDSQKVIDGFYTYLKNEDLTISKREFAMNVERKIQDSEFMGETVVLLISDIDYNAIAAWNLIQDELISKMI